MQMEDVGSIPNDQGSMYDIFTYIYHKSQPNVGKYSMHDPDRYLFLDLFLSF